jgi:hypothetical protein
MLVLCTFNTVIILTHALHTLVHNAVKKFLYAISRYLSCIGSRVLWLYICVC